MRRLRLTVAGFWQSGGYDVVSSRRAGMAGIVQLRGRARRGLALLACGLWLVLTTAARGGDPPSDDLQLARLVARGRNVRLDERVYQLRRSLSLRDQRGLVIEGAGPGTILAVAFGPQQATHPVIDMTGARECRLSNLSIVTAGKSTVPACGILLARSSPQSANHNTFGQVTIKGEFAVANVVNVGGELDTWIDPVLSNAAPGGHNYVTAGWWPDEWRKRVDSPAGPLWAGNRWEGPDYAGDGVHTFVAGMLGVYGHTGAECNVWILPGGHMVTFTGTYFSNKAKDKDRSRPDNGGLAAVRVGAPGARKFHNGLAFFNCWFETNGARHTFLVHGDAAITITGGQLEALEDCLHEQGRLVEVHWTLSGVETRGGYARYDWGP